MMKDKIAKLKSKIAKMKLESMVKRCPFCEIYRTQDRIIEQRDNFYVVLSNPRRVEGHILIIANRHVKMLDELTTHEWMELMQTTADYIKKAIEFAGGAHYSHNFQPWRPNSKYKVEHFHQHVVPLSPGCGFHEKDPADVFTDLNDKEREKYTKLYKI